MATQPTEVDPPMSISSGSNVKGTNKRTVTETCTGGWDDVKDVADVVRGGHRPKASGGAPGRQQHGDPEFVELRARCRVLQARFEEKLRKHGFHELLESLPEGY